MNNPINFELAKLLKEKGFDLEVYHCYHKDIHTNRMNFLDFNSLCHGHSDDLIHAITGDSDYCFPPKISFNTSWYKDYDYYSAPIISEVIMWLYEKHKIWISVSLLYKDKWAVEIQDVSSEGFIKKDGSLRRYPKDITGVELHNKFCNSPTKAYEAGIKHVLTNLI